MKEFAFLFRQADFDYKDRTPEQMTALTKKWKNWIGDIAAQGKVIKNGQRLKTDGRVLKAGGVVTDGPFVEIREMLGSFIVVRADNFDDALSLAHGCPCLDEGGSVEIREIMY